MAELKNEYVLDTVALSNFAVAGRLDLLLSRYGKRLKVTQEVLDEITDGVVAGYAELRAVEELVDDGRFMKTKPASKDERLRYRELLRVLGPGEASCIAYAGGCGAVVVTDDKTARECCIERDIKCTGTIGVLKACCMDGLLSVEEADKALEAMTDAGYYAPVKRISDLL